MCSVGGSAWMTRRHVVDVDAAGGDVGGDQRRARVPEWNASRLRVRAFWPRLPCSSTAGTPRRVELPGQRLGTVLGAGEDHGAAGRAGQVEQHRQPVLAARRAARGGSSSTIGDCAESASWVTGSCRNCRTRTSIAAVQGGGEQQPLAVAGRLAEQPAHGGQEAEVGHVVGLVEHGDLHVGRGCSGPGSIRSSSRPGQATTMSTPRRRPLDLRALADAAEDGPRGQAERAAASGASAASIWPTSSRVGARIRARGRPADGAAAAGGEPGDQRQQERVGLAGAGAAAAEHVTAGEGVGQRRGLDGGGGADAEIGEDVGQACGHAERAERGQRKRSLSVLVSHRQPVPDGFGRPTHGADANCCYARTTRGESSTSR